MRRVRVFQQTEMSTECDRCGARFDLMRGGVCDSCRRILCYRHLHGSWFTFLRSDLGGATVCVDCRTGRRAQRDAPA